MLQSLTIAFILQISLRTQLSNFKKRGPFRWKAAEWGQKEAKETAEQAVYATCVGANDYSYFVDNYPNATQLEQDEICEHMEFVQFRSKENCYFKRRAKRLPTSRKTKQRLRGDECDDSINGDD
uniref:Uncharacterized protein n=1 Tax=Populus alba TaxID=43335 RepID=A0A4U5PQG2_POPAL|nr:hypothetical protein D5086_0000199830 [Populus alba]